MEEQALLSRFEEFLTGITVCYKYIQRIKSAEMTEFGLKGTHVACLFYLHHNPDGLTATQLCTLCAEDKAGISRTVSELRERGYIEQSGEKHYRAPLHLSQAGHAVAQQMDPLIKSWVSVGGQGMSPEQRESFYQSLSLISENLRSKMAQNDT